MPRHLRVQQTCPIDVAGFRTTFLIARPEHVATCWNQPAPKLVFIVLLSSAGELRSRSKAATTASQLRVASNSLPRA
eukprot:630231-Rhodomonas_salina.1